MEKSSTVSDLKLFFDATTNDLKNANLVVMGIPWDISSSYRKGAVDGPLVIRRATSGNLYNSMTELGANINDVWSIFDCGDVEISSESAVKTRDEVLAAIKRTYKLDSHFLFLGGDHLTTYFAYSSLAKLSKKNPGIIYIDAHPDLWEEYPSDCEDQYSHACVVRRIIEETNVDPKNIVEVGIRAPTKPQIDYAREKGINIITQSEFQDRGPLETAIIATELLGDANDGIYISIDLDVLDPAFAPGVGNPQPGGLATRELLDFLHGLKHLNNIIAMDVVELCPPFDNSGITAFTSAILIKETLGVMGD